MSQEPIFCLFSELEKLRKQIFSGKCVISHSKARKNRARKLKMALTRKFLADLQSFEKKLFSVVELRQNEFEMLPKQISLKSLTIFTNFHDNFSTF